MGQKLRDKVALVTGASKGIGQGLAIGLSKSGAKVVVNYKTDSDGAEDTCTTIREAGGEAESYQADIGSKAEFENMINDVCSRFGNLDVLINNAARTRFGPPFDVTEEDFNDVVDTVLRGPFFGSIAAAKHMIEGNGGSIINISTIAAKVMLDFHSAYSMAKGGLETMTKQLAFELAPKVRVNCIGPTATTTQRNLDYDPDFNKKWEAITPAGRVATVEDYVPPCVFLASDDAEMITGQILYVDGGWTLQGVTPDMTNFDFSTDRKRD